MRGLLRKAGVLLAWAAAAALAWALARRSLAPGDEGYLLNQAALMLGGAVPYRDFDLFITPGGWMVAAAAMRAFGTSVVATRVVAAAALVATMAVAALVVRQATADVLGEASRRRWGRAAAAAIAVFAVWAFPSWTISFYSPYAILAVLAGLAFLQAGLADGRRGAFVAAGAAVGVAALFKQNFGALAAVGMAAAVLVDALLARRDGDGGWVRRVLGAWLALGAGAALAFAPVVAWLAAEGALDDAFRSVVLRPFQGFREGHSVPYLALGDLWERRQVWTLGGLRYLSVPMTREWVFASWPIVLRAAVQMMHSVLYWIPWGTFLALAVLGARGAWTGRGPARRAAPVVLVAAAVFPGVFPRSDFNHLASVMAPFLVLAVVLAARSFGHGRWRSGGVRRAAALATAAAAVAYTAVATAWTAELLHSARFPIASPRAGVLVDERTAASWDRQVGLLQRVTAPGESVFALPSLSAVAFLADRPMPSRYFNYLSVHVGHDGGRDAAREIDESGARVVLAQSFDFFADSEGILDFAPELARTLRSRFVQAESLDARSVVLMRRRVAPVAEDAAPRWALGDCDLAPTARGVPVRLRELLGPALYQPLATTAAGESTTRCRFAVPPASALRLTVDLRQPAASPQPVRVEAELRVVDGAASAVVLHDEWALSAEAPDVATAGREFEVDLARWAGRDVVLEWVARASGPVPDAPADPWGTSVAWGAPRVVARRP